MLLLVTDRLKTDLSACRVVCFMLGSSQLNKSLPEPDLSRACAVVVNNGETAEVWSKNKEACGQWAVNEAE